MSSYTNDAIYGANQAPYMTATMFNPNAQSDTDWGAVLANGIVGASQAALATMVGGAYASGQLVNPVAVQQQVAAQQRSQMTTFLIIGVVVYLATRG